MPSAKNTKPAVKKTAAAKKSAAPKKAAGSNRPASQKLDLSEPLFKLLEECQDITGAVVATADGHLIDSCVREGDLPMKELAAMSGTFVALGATLAMVLGQGICRNILVENENGTTLLLHAGEGIALMAATAPDARLGSVLSHSRKAAVVIAEIAKSSSAGRRSAA